MKKIAYAAEIILIAFLAARGIMLPFLAWLLSLLGLQMAFNFGSQALFLETLKDYPNNHRVNSGIFFPFYGRWYKTYNEGLPKEMYNANAINVINFCVYSILLLVFTRNEVVARWLGMIYICTFCVVVVVGYTAAYKRRL